MTAKRALITGISGQDGSYLAELLADYGYEVHGMIRWSSSHDVTRTERLRWLHERSSVVVHHGDMSDSGALHRLVREIQPVEIYNLAAQSHVHISFDQPDYTTDVVALGTLRLLEAIRACSSAIKFFQASSSEMFGSTRPPHDETARFYPRSPYAAAKVYAHHITVNYREAHGIFASCGIMFNHESPRRGVDFVTRKVTKGVARAIAQGCSLQLGDLTSRRDWGHARDYVRAMWMILQQSEPEDFVIGTGLSRSVGELVSTAFGMVGLDWRDHVEMSARYIRPTDVSELVADASKAREELAWEPSITFEDMIYEMLENDLREEGLNPVSYLSR